MTKAEEAYAALLSGDPQAPAPAQGPPRLREAFRRVKERLYPPGFVGLMDRPAPEGRVAVALTDPWSLVASLVLSQALDARVDERAMTPDETGLATGTLLPGARSWFVEARDDQGTARASLGTRAQPRLLSVPEPVVGVASVVAPAPVPQRSRVLPIAATVVAVGLAATASTFAGLGVSAHASAGMAGFASDTRALDLQSRTQLTFAWGFGIAAVVMGAAAVVLWVW